MKVKWGNMEMVMMQAGGLLLTRRSGTQRRARDRDLYIKMLFEQKKLLKQLALLNIQIQKNNATLNTIIERRETLNLLLSLRLMVRNIPAMVLPLTMLIPGESVDATFPFDTEEADAQYDKAIRDIDREYSIMFDEIINK